MPRSSALVRSLGGRKADDPALSILLVAAVTAALGGVLARQADWQGRHVLAGWLAYAVLGGIVLGLADFRREGIGFGIAN